MVFRIFDEDSSGLLTADELANVLAANHMQSLEAVQKTETIMRRADRDGNELGLDEFRIVTEKCEFVVDLSLVRLIHLFIHLFIPSVCLLLLFRFRLSFRLCVCVLTSSPLPCFFLVRAVPNILFPAFCKETVHCALLAIGWQFGWCVLRVSGWGCVVCGCALRFLIYSLRRFFRFFSSVVWFYATLVVVVV